MKILLYTFLALLIAATFVPALDIATSGFFYNPAPTGPGSVFGLRDNAIADMMHEGIQWGARILAVALILLATARRHTKAALFLLAALLVGPGLVTNTVLKDNWDRARPLQITEFGGTAHYTPAWQPTDQCDHNCSFVSGDGAIGFFLHAFFYIVPPPRRRMTFLLGFVGGGALAGGLRIAMGAHFLSDVLWAGVVVVLTTAFVHMLFYGWGKTADAWRSLIK